MATSKLPGFAREHVDLDERILLFLRGVIPDNAARQRVIVATDKRVFVADSMGPNRGSIGGFRHDLYEFPYHLISAVDVSHGFMMARVTLRSPEQMVTTHMVARAEAAKLPGIIRPKITVATKNTKSEVSVLPPPMFPPAMFPPSSDISALEKLERLATLYQSGALSDQEFSDAKTKLLGEL